MAIRRFYRLAPFCLKDVQSLYDSPYNIPYVVAACTHALIIETTFVRDGFRPIELYAMPRAFISVFPIVYYYINFNSNNNLGPLSLNDPFRGHRSIVGQIVCSKFKRLASFVLAIATLPITTQALRLIIRLVFRRSV